MKILIAYSHSSEINLFLKEIDNEAIQDGFKYKHLTIDFVEVAYTSFETSFAMAKALAKGTYHLVLFAGFANSLNTKMNVGDVLNLINDLPFGIGIESEDAFENAYQLSWLDKGKHPHKRGGFINMSNAYFNVFLPFMKTASITSNVLEGNEETVALKINNFPLHVETSNGVGFQYACLHEGVSFYQMRAVSKNVVRKSENKNLAKEKLNFALKNIIDLL